MYQTLTSAIQDVSADSCDRETRRKALLKMLEQTELAVINSATQTGVIKYQINTGQTIISVQQASYTDLVDNYKKLLALCNELYGIEAGENIMAMRDAQSNRSGFGELI